MAKRGPRPVRVVISPSERITLEQWARRRTTAQGLAQRARIILACAAGHAAPAIAAELRITRQTVGRWRRRFLQKRLETANAGGMAAERLLIDPGIGFGKGARHNLELLRKLHHFHALGQPIVIGTSRKAFIGWILGSKVEERLEGTAATVAAAALPS